ncbi:MAG: rhodanese-like domain-containing protein [Deltaproteobacteria bacterium]|nr:rhodanese-like domain-containing protein [Deltaproteobacteria bacterium]
MTAVGKNRKPRTGTLRLSRAIWQGIFRVFLGALLAAGFNAVRTTGLAWTGAWSPASLAASQRQGLEEIPLQEAWSLSQAGRALFVDARDPVSFYEGHIKGALNVPPGEAGRYLEEIRTLSRAGLEVITYCDGVDCPLSTELARSLQQSGVASVRVLVDGWGRWRKAGYPTEKGNR